MRTIAMINAPTFKRSLTLASFIFILAAAWSCSSKAKMAEETQEASPEAFTAEAALNYNETEAQPSDSLVLSLDCTPCYGRCPTYKVRVYESGYATYEGINFVNLMGQFYTQLPENEVENIKTTAREAGFFEFEESYDLFGLQDLPDNILKINTGTESHRVNARFEVPRHVQRFFNEMAERLDGYDWKAKP